MNTNKVHMLSIFLIIMVFIVCNSNTVLSEGIKDKIANFFYNTNNNDLTNTKLSTQTSDTIPSLTSTLDINSIHNDPTSNIGIACPSCCDLNCDPYVCDGSNNDKNYDKCCVSGCCDKFKDNTCNEKPIEPLQCNKHISCTQSGFGDFLDNVTQTISLDNINSCLMGSKQTCIDSGSVQIIVLENNNTCCIDPIKVRFILYAVDRYSIWTQTIFSRTIDPCANLPPCNELTQFDREQSKCIVKGSSFFLNVTFIDFNPNNCIDGFTFDVVLNTSGEQCKAKEVYSYFQETILYDNKKNI